MDVRGPAIPIHIARAYAAAAPRAGRPPFSPAESTPHPDRWEAPPRTIVAAQALVAARVPGPIDFAPHSAAPAAPTGPALPMYRHPADRNAAATGVEAGRVIDVSG